MIRRTLGRPVCSLMSEWWEDEGFDLCFSSYDVMDVEDEDEVEVPALGLLQQQRTAGWTVSLLSDEASSTACLQQQAPFGAQPALDFVESSSSCMRMAGFVAPFFSSSIVEVDVEEGIISASPWVGGIHEVGLLLVFVIASRSSSQVT